jgi:hypothetical protein
MGDVLAKLLVAYKNEPDGTNLPFFQWLDSLSYFEVCKKLKEQAFCSTEWVRQFAPLFTKGVKYMDQMERNKHRVFINPSTGKIFRRRLETLDTTTQGFKTLFSGKGWGIWVMSPQAGLYTCSHIKGELQHSSLLAGGKVMGAGEWKVEGGVLKMISGKSGHYRCDIEMFHAALQRMEAMGVAMGNVDVILWLGGEPKLVKAGKFLSDPQIKNTYRPIGRNTPFDPVRDEPKKLIGAHRTAQTGN